MNLYIVSAERWFAECARRHRAFFAFLPLSTHHHSGPTTASAAPAYINRTSFSTITTGIFSHSTGHFPCLQGHGGASSASSARSSRASI